MESLSIPVGYGVELSTLLDTAATRGLDAIAQVDLGSRGHKHQTDHDLALTAAELLIRAERRRPDLVRNEPVPWPDFADVASRVVTRQAPIIRA